MELFAEHPPAIQGQPLRLLSHLTRLDGFKPVDAGTVRLDLRGPTGQAEATATKPLRPGIYALEMTAPSAGTYQAAVRVDGPGFSGTVEGFKIQVFADETAAAKAAAEPSEDSAEPIRFLKEQQWEVPFATVFAKHARVVPSVEVSGEVVAPPNGEAELGASVAGRLVAPPEGLPRPGQTVKKGQLLASVAPRPSDPEGQAMAQLAVVEAGAALEAAQKEVERSQKLLAERAIPARHHEEAERALRVAEQALRSAQQQRSLHQRAAAGSGGGAFRIISPIDGVLVEVQANLGKAVNGGDPLFRVINLDHLWLRARVPEQQASRLVTDQNAAYRLYGLETWHPINVAGDRPNASVVSASRVVHPRTRSVDIIYALNQADPSLRIGAALQIAVPVGSPWQGLAVPRTAVFRDEGRDLVYVQTDGESFEARTVRTGTRSGTDVAILSGLAVGERVVTTGANVVRLVSRASESVGHGHVH